MWFKLMTETITSAYLADVDGDQAPDPTDTVTLLRSDFDMLQAAANAAMQDFGNLVELLGLEVPPGAVPRQFMHDVVLPMVAKLVTTQGMVEQAGRELLERAKTLGNKTIELPGGQKGLLVGQKRSDIFLNRDERRGR